jgi:hypothetical protein
MEGSDWIPASAGMTGEGEVSGICWEDEGERGLPLAVVTGKIDVRSFGHSGASRNPE